MIGLRVGIVVVAEICFAPGAAPLDPGRGPAGLVVMSTAASGSRRALDRRRAVSVEKHRDCGLWVQESTARFNG